LKKYYPLFLAVLLILQALPSLIYADEQGWNNNSLTVALTSRWSLKLTNEIRANELTLLDPFLKNFQGGLVYKLPGNFYAAALYKRENTKKTEFNLAENRLTFEGGWKTALGKTWDMDMRVRVEVRRFDLGLSQNHMRYRFRVRLRTKLKIGGIEFRPFLATEPFADSIQNRIFRNRFYIGSSIPLSKNASITINYIRQDTKNKQTLHILNTGVDLKF
jgi:hypothetical protein